MDPLSIIAGVTGIAAAGAQLANALFDMISTYRNAPIEITSIARGIQDLSVVLDRLIDVLEDGQKLHTQLLRQSVASAVGQIDDVHVEVWDFIDRGESGFGRIKWAIRKNKIKDLMSKIEAHKSTIQLVCTTLLLAVQQTKISESKTSGPVKQRRARLRCQAEGLVKAAAETLLDLSEANFPEAAKESQSDLGALADEQSLESRSTEESSTKQFAKLSFGKGKHFPASDEELKNGRDLKETALWLYQTVFARTAERDAQEQAPQPALDENNVLMVEHIRGADMRISRKHVASRVVDDLLFDWTDLGWHSIEEMSKNISSGPDMQYTERPHDKRSDDPGSGLRPGSMEVLHHQSNGLSELPSARPKPETRKFTDTWKTYQHLS